MTIPQWTLLGFALWTIGVPLSAVGIYRWNLIFRGARGIHTFPADASEGADWYRRAMRAHANCVENLPVFASLVALASFAGLHSSAFATLSMTVMFTRMGQTLTHVGFTQTERAVTIRFSFFFVQLCCMVAMAVMLWAHAR